MQSDERTLQFYAREADAYALRSDRLGPSNQLNTFLAALPRNAAVLDLGCGTGRDTKIMIEVGFDVTALDGCPEMAREAKARTGLAVRVLLFEALDYVARFDGIWANASLLHVPRAALPNVLARVHQALKADGLLFASFKSGGNEGRDTLGRYYNYLNRDELETHVRAVGTWAALDIDEGRGKGYDGTETGWVRVFARKSGNGI